MVPLGSLASLRYKVTLLYTPARGGEIRLKHLENVVFKRRGENKEPADGVQSQKTPTHNPQPTPRKQAH